MGQFLSKFDTFADPVSLTFKGLRGHSTAFGGFVSLISTFCLISYFIWRLTFISNNERDDYMLSSIFTDFDKREPYFLHDTEDFKFKVTAITGIKDFNLTDNPYGEFKLHRYTNIEDAKDINGSPARTTLDKIIPLIDCDYGTENNDDWNLGQKYLCPQFSK